MKKCLCDDFDDSVGTVESENRQSMAEAIAKHLNDDYLKKLRKK